MGIKAVVKQVLPFGVLNTLRTWRMRQQARTVQSDVGAVFDRIHDENLWNSGTSVSGPGSETRETEEVRALLPDLIHRLGIRSMLDAPCGDFSWMRRVDLDGCRYTGADIVNALIEANRSRFGTAGRVFIQADLARTNLPCSDLILCRDCLIHLDFELALSVLRNFRKSGSTHLLITTDPSVTDNHPVFTGGFRSLNLQRAPFRFPAPVELHRDRFKPAAAEALLDPHKHLGLWRLAELPL